MLTDTHFKERHSKERNYHSITHWFSVKGWFGQQCKWLCSSCALHGAQMTFFLIHTMPLGGLVLALNCPQLILLSDPLLIAPKGCPVHLPLLCVSLAGRPWAGPLVLTFYPLRRHSEFYTPSNSTLGIMGNLGYFLQNSFAWQYLASLRYLSVFNFS